MYSDLVADASKALRDSPRDAAPAGAADQSKAVKSHKLDNIINDINDDDDADDSDRLEIVRTDIPGSEPVSEDGDKHDLDPAGRPTLTHVDRDGRARMVDVGGKRETRRVAVATARVVLGSGVTRLVTENVKGDVLTVAELAGVMAAKATAALIPLCHPVALTHVDVRLAVRGDGVDVSATAVAYGRTGVEMEALVAASVAALTVYDMCKAASHDIVITDVRLERKTGGRSGEYRRQR